MFCITSRRYGDNAKQHRFYYIFKQSSVFFHMFDRLFYIMIMNRLHCEGSVENSVLLKCRKLRREDQETSDSIVGFFIEKKTQCDGRLQSSKSHLK